MACRTETNCRNCRLISFCCPAAKETSTVTETKESDSALWKDADLDIPILKEAKTEYAKLM